MITEEQRRDRRHALTGQIEILGRTNVHVHAALQQAHNGACGYDEAMQMVVLQLAAIVESQQNTIIEFAKRQPAPYIVRTAP